MRGACCRNGGAIAVPAARETEARRIARRARQIAIGGHLLSALVIAVLGYVSGLQVGYYFASFYLVSTAFRPAGAYFKQMSEWLRGTAREVRYPREDVTDLRRRVRTLERSLDSLRKQQQDDVRSLRVELRDQAASLHQTASTLTERQTRLAAQVDTTNHEVIAGIKGFLRLLKAEGT